MRPCLGRSRAQSTQCHEHACLSRKSCVTQFVHRFGMGGVAHWLGSNIADRGFTCTRYSAVIDEFGEPAQKISIERVLLWNQLLCVGSNETFLKFRYHRIEVGPQVFRQKVVSICSPVTCVDGFQNLQTITLGCRDEFCLMSSLELVPSVSVALTTHHGIQILPQGQ